MSTFTFSDAPATSRSDRRWAPLDGLRAAVLLVAAYHFNRLGAPRSVAERALHFVVQVGSFVGMDMFFVLSGFLITGLLLDSREDRRYFGAFYGRRFLRIFPVYYGFLALWLVVLPRLLPDLHRLFDRAVSMQVYYWTYTLNLRVFVLKDAGFGNSMNHFWSLMVEEQFYLLWPLVVRYSPLPRLRQIAVALMILSPLLRVTIWHLVPATPLAAYKFTFSHCEGLALGALLAIQARAPGGLRRWIPRSRWAAGICLAVIVAIYAATGRFDPPHFWSQSVGTVASTLLGGAIVLATLTARPAALGSRILAHPVLTTLGRFSYAFYVVHWPLCLLLDTFGIGRWADFRRWLPGPVSAQLAYSASRALAAIAVAALSWYLVEKRVLALRRYLPYGFERDRPPTAGAADSAGGVR